ncbi:Luciferin 4-monooxygenase, partial [Gonioctena quinquepunctata]
LKLPAIRQGYGLTEANLAITLMKPNDLNKPGSVGKVITFMSITVRDPESGKWLGPNKVGEICATGPMMMSGYYKNEQATRETFTSDGWLKTGDLGYYDDEGYFYIVDRLKELIKYKGFQVAPAELEALLINHPKVLDVGVVGAPDDLAGELPLAFVVKKEGIDVTERELQEYVAKRVSPQKRLRGGVFFVPAIPKNPTGKILRRELRKNLANYKIQQESKL